MCTPTSQGHPLHTHFSQGEPWDASTRGGGQGSFSISICSYGGSSNAAASTPACTRDRSPSLSRLSDVVGRAMAPAVLNQTDLLASQPTTHESQLKSRKDLKAWWLSASFARPQWTTRPQRPWRPCAETCCFLLSSSGLRLTSPSCNSRAGPRSTCPDVRVKSGIVSCPIAARSGYCFQDLLLPLRGQEQGPTCELIRRGGTGRH